MKRKFSKKPIFLALAFLIALSSALFLHDRLRNYFTHLINNIKNEPPAPYVAVEVVDDVSQVFLYEKNHKTQLSFSEHNHSDPFMREDFVVWVESPKDRSEKRIARFHKPTSTLVHLTDDGVGQSPRVSAQGNVVWQSWNDDQWQLMWFDGTASHQLKNTGGAFHPDISNYEIVYAKKVDDQWVAIKYQLSDNTQHTVRKGPEAKHPIFSGEIIDFTTE